MKLVQTPALMLRASETLEFVRKAGRRVTVQNVAYALDVDNSSARRYVAMLLELGKLNRYWVPPTKDMPRHYVFSISDDSTPVVVPMFGPRTNTPRCASHHEHQATVPAVQLGLKRDPWVAAIFGEPRP